MSGIMRALVGACHPEPTVGVTALATALAAAAGGSAERVTLVAVTVLAGQLSIGWSNDAIDAARDVATGRTDKPVATGQIGSRVVGGAAVTALAVAVALSLVAGPAAALAHLVVLGGGWAYNLGLKRTLLSWLPYAVAFGALPAYSVLALPGAAVPAPWLVATGSLLGVGAHFFNVLPDIADDRATGVRSLPVRLGATASRWAGCGCLVAAAGVLVLGAPGARRPAGFAGLLLATALAVTAAVAGRQGGRARAPFLLAMLAAAVDLALLVVLVDRGAELG